MSLPTYSTPAYGITRILQHVTMDEAIERVTASLGAEGFGVLTRIDVDKTFQAKLDVEIAPYVILGACSPALAQQALQVDPGLGLLMPCNVVVATQANGEIVLSAADAPSLFKALDDATQVELRDLGLEVRAQLSRAIDNA